MWRKHEGSDDMQGTYAHWLMYGIFFWNQDGIPLVEPFKKGPLLREM